MKQQVKTNQLVLSDLNSVSTLHYNKVHIRKFEAAQLHADSARRASSSMRIDARHANHAKYRVSVLALFFFCAAVIVWMVTVAWLPPSLTLSGFVLMGACGVNSVLFQLSSWVTTWGKNAQQVVSICPNCFSHHVQRKRRSWVQRLLCRFAGQRIIALKCRQCDWRGLSGVQG